MIELSADLGEGSPGEAELWPLLHAANIACGGHVGDAASMTAAVQSAQEHSVRIGAHPSYPDREHFGRRSLDLPREELIASLVVQLESLRAIAGELHHVKPHGALYNDAHRDRQRAESIVDAIAILRASIALVAPDHSEMAAAARARGMRVIREAFADRRYEPDGSLTPRSKSGALLTVEQAAAQAALLASDGVVIASDGSRVAVRFDTICIHADMDRAAERLRAIHAALS